MADIASSNHHTRHPSTRVTALPGMPVYEMLATPDFSFPAKPGNPTLPMPAESPPDLGVRPASMHFNFPQPSATPSIAHRRAVSTLPSFTFNARDSSGLRAQHDSPASPASPAENVAPPPPKRGHRRGGSELVGGDSRLGFSNAVSTSPTKTFGPPLQAPSAGSIAGSRGHAHRRSAALSNHDVKSIIQPSNELESRLSSSVPTSPMDFRSPRPYLEDSGSAPDVEITLAGAAAVATDTTADRPPSRPRVEFANEVQYIPRPLSTISSDTESSTSVSRGHSLDNSISSMLSAGIPSFPSSRTPTTSLNAALEAHARPPPRSSIEIRKRIEKEGEWLKSGSSQNLRRPNSESGPPSKKSAKSAEGSENARNGPQHTRTKSVSGSAAFDRRKSEPMIGMTAEEQTRLSTVSLQDSLRASRRSSEGQDAHRSSWKRFKQMAVSKIPGLAKDVPKSMPGNNSTGSLQSQRSQEDQVPGMVPIAQPDEPGVPDTDVSAVIEKMGQNPEASRSVAQPPINFSLPSPTFQQHSGQKPRYYDDSPMLDLDAALGPFKTPPIGGPQKQRKDLHSSRTTRDFMGPGGLYHRRTESAPALSAFDFTRPVATSQSAMADVFEEEEEEEAVSSVGDTAVESASPQSQQHDLSGVGISIVDSSSTSPYNTLDWGSEDRFGMQPRGEWEPDRPMSSYSNAPSRLSMPLGDGRRSSVIEDTIIEEPGPGESVEVVQAYEEPRTSSLTKSSDSSETPTILDVAANRLPSTFATPHLTPTTEYETSACPSPDFSAPPSFFDHSLAGTAASSIADDRRTVHSYSIGGEPSTTETHRTSAEDVPSLSSSPSTMLTMHNNISRRDLRSIGAHSSSSASASGAGDHTPSGPYEIAPDAADLDDAATAAAFSQRKRGSIHSLSQLVGHSFGGRSRDGAGGMDRRRPHTAAAENLASTPTLKKREHHRLKKLMFWKSKQNLRDKPAS